MRSGDATSEPLHPRPGGRLASFVAVVDPDALRLEGFKDAVRARVAPVDGLRPGEASTAAGGWVAWAAAAATSVDVATHAEAGLGVVWGRPLHTGTARPACAAEVRDGWLGPRSGGRSRFDGYHAAVAMRGARLVVGCDLLGAYPVYHASADDVVVVASSAELVVLHPAFPRRIDVLGLVGTLMWMGPIAGRGLLEGVRRLGPGRVVVWERGARADERPHYALPEVPRAAEATGSDQLTRFRAALGGAVERQASGGSPPGLLLSGGRDSRLLAGHLRDRGIAFRPTIIPNDLDADPARAVARRLGLEPVEIVPRVDDAVRSARLQARWHTTEVGFYSVHLWGLNEALAGVADRTVTGFLLGRIAGGWGLNPAGHADRTDVFERFVEVVNATAVGVQAMRGMLRAPLRDAVDQALADLKREWTDLAADTNERVWRYELLYADRSHVASIPWRMSCATWPLLPVLDEGLLAWAAQAPLSLYAARSLQDRALAAHFPDLAALPYVDEGRAVAEPLRRTLVGTIARRLRRGRAGTYRTPDGASVPAARPYRDRHTLFDGEAWRAIRREAEPMREALTEWFEPEALDAWLPGPDEALGSAEMDQMGRQAMVGFMIWLGLEPLGSLDLTRP